MVNVTATISIEDKHFQREHDILTGLCFVGKPAFRSVILSVQLFVTSIALKRLSGPIHTKM